MTERRPAITGDDAGRLARLEELAPIALELDVERLLAQVLTTTTKLLGADGAAIVIQSPGEPPRVAVRGLDAGFDTASTPHGGGSIALAGPGGPLGQLFVLWHEPRRDASPEEVAALEEIAAQVGPAIGNALAHEDAQRRASLDSLTGLLTRQRLHDDLAHEITRARRYHHRLAVMALDLDCFKHVNDTLGHQAGDDVLVEFAQKLQELIRTTDIACRPGGDEFVLILPEAGVTEAKLLFMRLRTVRALAAAGDPAHPTFSAGIAELQEDDDEVSLLARADGMLYRAKRAGKDRAFAEAGAVAPEEWFRASSAPAQSSRRRSA